MKIGNKTHTETTNGVCFFQWVWIVTSLPPLTGMHYYISRKTSITLSFRAFPVAMETAPSYSSSAIRTCKGWCCDDMEVQRSIYAVCTVRMSALVEHETTTLLLCMCICTGICLLWLEDILC